MSQKEVVGNFLTNYNISDLTTESIAIHADGSLVNCNDNFLHAFGYNQSEIIGLNLFNFFPKIYRDILSTVEKEGEKRIETLCVRKDSSTFPATVICKNIVQNDQLIHALIIRDESERNRLENELLKTTVFQRAILNSSTFAIISTDFNGLIKTFNKGAELLFGYSQEEIVNKVTLPELYQKEEIEKRSEELSEELNSQIAPGLDVFVANLQKNTVDESDWTGISKNGSKFYTSLTVTTLKDSMNEISGYLFTAIDITDKKKAQVEIFEKSQMLNGIISNMPVFVFQVCSDGSFVKMIESGLDHQNIKKSDFIGKNIYEIFPKKKEKIDAAFDGKSITFINTTHHTQLGEHYEFYLFPDLSNRGGLIGFALDITDKILSERKLEESAQNLEKINNELNQFAYIVSHDLKSPLRAINNLSTWIEEDIKDVVNDDGLKNLRLLQDRVWRMQKLIDGILNYTKIGRINTKFESINTNELIHDTINSLKIPDTFSIIVDENLPVVDYNRTWLEQVFTSLIHNAWKFHHQETGKIKIRYKKVDEYHQFIVKDDGPGIPKDQHERVFQIFHTLQSKDVMFNTGVGLTIVKKIINEFGGNITLESDGNSGSTFTFTIPVKPYTK